MTRVPDIDDVITAAARSLVVRDVERPLAARVHHRLGRQRARTWEWRAAMAAAALFVTIALSLPRPDMPHVEPPVLSLPRAARVLPLPPLADQPAMPTASLAAAEGVTSRGSNAPALSEAEIEWMTARVPLLHEPPALTVTVSQPEPMSVALLEVEEVATPRLSVPPIGTARVPREP